MTYPSAPIDAQTQDTLDLLTLGKRRHIVRTDPRFLYSYSPGDGATRYVFQHGERTSDYTALGLKDAVLFVMDNPPTDRDYERTTGGSAMARGEV